MSFVNLLEADEFLDMRRGGRSSTRNWWRHSIRVEGSYSTPRHEVSEWSIHLQSPN